MEKQNREESQAAIQLPERLDRPHARTKDETRISEGSEKPDEVRKDGAGPADDAVGGHAIHSEPH